MNLSELKTGEKACITGISGKGAIKKRLNEMGFIAGRDVRAIKAAPFKDPVEYDIMGYKLTLRQKDASMIQVRPGENPRVHPPVKRYHEWMFKNVDSEEEQTLHPSGETKTIHVALVGNPNCGKTTIFNFATHSRERVANYSGVTVAAKEAQLEISGYTIKLIDLPGTYSLSSYSPEEMFVTDYLLYKKPDLVINVIDAGNLERNLFLTTQLIDAGIKTIVALNMYDELQAAGSELDYVKLGKMLGMPFVPTVGSKGKGLKELFQTVIRAYRNEEKSIRAVPITYGKEIEDALAAITTKIHGNTFGQSQPSRFFALQLLEGESNILSALPVSKRKSISEFAGIKRQAIKNVMQHDLDTEIVHQRYGFIQGALHETYQQGTSEKIKMSQKIDAVLTHKILGLPVFFGIIWFIFFATFKLGEIPMNGIEMLFGWLSGIVSGVVPQGVFNSLLVDGVIGGVGGVMVFLPNIVILFFLISLMEDSGYMARTAFLMDKSMHRAGLHGKSFIPLLMGFGCNVPAVMATRTIESKRDRMVTMFITPFMSCSARLPVYVLFISAFFPFYASFMLFGMYAIGILAALITTIILNHTVFRKTESPFVMELPPYRLPTLTAVTRHTWFKTSHFLKKMGTIILFASVIVWALSTFPQDQTIIAKYDHSQHQLALQTNAASSVHSDRIRNEIAQLETLKQSELLEQSYISRIGKSIQPLFDPLGFDWRMSVSILTGLMAKEVVVSSMGILYQSGSDADESNPSFVEKLRTAQKNGNVPLIIYFGFLVFTLLYFPCLGTLVAIKKETARWKWTLFAAGYPFVFAWLVTFVLVQIGILF